MSIWTPWKLSTHKHWHLQQVFICRYIKLTTTMQTWQSFGTNLSHLVSKHVIKILLLFLLHCITDVISFTIQASWSIHLGYIYNHTYHIDRQDKLSWQVEVSQKEYEALVKKIHFKYMLLRASKSMRWYVVLCRMTYHFDFIVICFRLIPA